MLTQRKAQAQQQQQYPILDKVAAKIVQKYQTSTCEQLWEKKSQKAPPSAGEQKVIQMLHEDAQMRGKHGLKLVKESENPDLIVVGSGG